MRPIVVINKIDRPNIDPHIAVDKVFDLFVELGANEKQLDFPYIFASGVKGIATKNPETDPGTDLRPLLDLIVEHCPCPTGDPINRSNCRSAFSTTAIISEESPSGRILQRQNRRWSASQSL